MHQQKSTAAKDAPDFVKKTNGTGYMVEHIGLDDEIQGVVNEREVECVHAADVEEVVFCQVGEPQPLRANELAAESAAAAYIHTYGIRPDVLVHPFEAAAQQPAKIAAFALSVVCPRAEDVALSTHSIVSVSGFVGPR